MPHGAIPFPFGDCRICEDKATGIHYGVATCEGCKGFFKRSLPKRDKFSCFFGGQCQVTRLNRNRCKACRFKRCLDNGMAVEAVKMGRIPKLEKERALHEATYPTVSIPTPGSTSNDSQAMAETLSDPPKVESEWRDEPAFQGASATSAAMASSNTTPEVNANMSTIMPGHLKSSTSSGNQSGYERMELSHHYTKGIRVHKLDDTYNESDKKVSPQTSVSYNSHANHPGFDHYGKNDTIYNSSTPLRNAKNISEFVATRNSAANNSTFTDLPIQPIPKSSEESFSVGQPRTDCLSSPMNSSRNHSLCAKTLSLDTFQPQGPFSENGRDDLLSGPSVSSISMSFEVKKEILENQDTNTEQKPFGGLQNKLFATTSHNQSNRIDSLACSNLGPLSQNSTYKKPSFQKKNGPQVNTASRIENVFPENNFHRSNSFADMGNTNAFAEIPKANSDIAPCVGETKADVHGSNMSHTLSRYGDDARYISNWQHSSQNESRSPLLSTQTQPSFNAVTTPTSHPLSICTSNSGTLIAGNHESIDFKSSVNSNSNCRGLAYSPNMVKVLLNQVGGERLKGLKQHIMTGIAPECAPEQFQAAADLLRQYSEDSSTSSSTSDVHACTLSPAGVQHNSTYQQFGPTNVLGMGSSQFDASNKSTSVLNIQQTSFSNPNIINDNSQDSIVYNSVDHNQFNNKSNFLGKSVRNTSHPYRIDKSPKAGLAKHGLSSQNSSLNASGNNPVLNPSLNGTIITGAVSKTSWRRDASSFKTNRNESFPNGGKNTIHDVDQNCIMDLDTADLVVGDYMKEYFNGDDNRLNSRGGSSEQVPHYSTSQHNGPSNYVVNGMLQHSRFSNSSKVSMLQDHDSNNSFMSNILQQNRQNDTSEGSMLQHNGQNDTATGSMLQHNGQNNNSTGSMMQHNGQNNNSADCMLQQNGRNDTSTGSMLQHNDRNDTSTSSMLQHNGQNNNSTGSMLQHNDRNDTSTGSMLQHKGRNDTSAGSMLQHNGRNDNSAGSILQQNRQNNDSTGSMLQHNGRNDTSVNGVSQNKLETDKDISDISRTVSSAFDTHLTLFKVMHNEMLEILQNKRPMPVHPIVPGSKAIVYEQLIASIETINKAIIGFCNCVPGLSALPKADKDYLTKRAYYDIWMFTNSRLFHDGQSYLRLPDYTYYNRDWMEIILNKEIVQVFFDFSVAFNSLELSDLEVAILCAIQLTSPGNESPGVCPITSKEKVEHINSQLVDLLVLEVGRRHRHNGPRVLVDIFRLLPKLAEINTLQQEIIANFTADTAPENVKYSPKSAPLADIPEELLNAV